jgi:hypothetical protein
MIPRGLGNSPNDTETSPRRHRVKHHAKVDTRTVVKSMGFNSTLKKIRENLPAIEAERDWISQSWLSNITGIDTRTIREMRKRGEVDSDTVRANDIWISVESIKRYCTRAR